MKRSVRLTLASICAVIITLCCIALGLYTFNYMGFEDGKLKFYFGQKDETPDEPKVPLDTKYTIHLVWSEGNKSQDYTYDPANETFSPTTQNVWIRQSANSGKLYRFDGWYTDELYYDVADPVTIRNGDTVYAKMIEQVTVTIHNIYPSNSNTKEEYVVDKYSVFNLDDKFTSTTAEFFGVYKDSNKSETATDFQASANSDIYAYWSSKYSDFKWETDSSTKTAKITDYKGKAKKVIIPVTYVKNETNFTVTEIGYDAFQDCNVTSVEIPDSVTSIGPHAFQWCRSLTSITIPDGVTSIGEYTFDSCESLTSITIPDGVTSIGDHAFYYCTSLTSITIPDSVTSIGNYAFSIVPV